MLGLPPDGQMDQVLSRAAAGDGQAWRDMVGAYSGRVYGLLKKMCGDGDLAEEITQATFVKVVEHLGGYQERGKFESWLFRIAVNQLRDEIRRRGRQGVGKGMGGAGERDGRESGLEVEARDSGRTPLEEISHAEQLEEVRKAVRELGEADREVLYLRHTAGLSFAQIAEALDQPLGTVLARAHRAIGKLRELLDDPVEDNR
ncbi:MAG: RNA polymerase sigma factor [Phycisphaeraceae bacterium]|nr:RNA polymerase sigma factor [Phycisphaeraceae bacterium]